MKREDIYAAVFSILNPLKVSGVLKKTSRRLEFAEEVAAEETPGVWQLQGRETPRYVFDGVYGWDLDLKWYIYVTQNDETQPSSPIFNPVLDAVLALLPNAETGGQFTLGGVTCTLKQNGPVLVYEGILNNKAVVEIPLSILVPDPLTGA